MFVTKKRIDEITAKLSSLDSSVNNACEQISLLTDMKEKNLQLNRSNESRDAVDNSQISQLNDTEKIQIAYALNLCTVSISQIIDYNDLIVLEQEYDAILNNLNLQKFKKHDALLKVIKQILDTINYFRIQEIEKDIVEKEYRQNMKNAIWKAVPNIGMIISGGDPITIAITAVTQIGIGYMNYRNLKNEASREKERKEWELQRAAKEQFHCLRRDLFETAWRLSDIYNFDDKYRLTEKQISHYISILRDPDPMRRYEKLDVISESYEAFPLYWYYKARAAKKICDASKDVDPVTYDLYRPIFHDEDTYEAFRRDYREKALEAFNHFEAIHEHVQFFREDVLASSCALDHISLLDPVSDKDKIEKLLNKAIRLAPDNFEIMQMCVMVQGAILKDPKATQETLQRLVNEDYNTSLNGLLLSRIYYQNNKRIDYDILCKRIGDSNVFPWCENYDEANILYIESRQTTILHRFIILAMNLVGNYYRKAIRECGFADGENMYDIKKFKESDALSIIHKSFNDIFSELEQFPFFRNPEDYGLNPVITNDYASYSIDNDWKTFTEELETRFKSLNDIIPNKNNKNRKILESSDANTSNSDRLKKTVQSIMNENLFKTDIVKLYNKLVSSITKYFQGAITIKAVDPEISDSILYEIDNWYKRNNVALPKTTKRDIEKMEIIPTVSTRLFFEPSSFLSSLR
jgi:hypothetical protein